MSASANRRTATSHGVDVLNFILIWVTLGAALAWPFQLFLFSYIVLGPLHYLTEINWLDKQDYFIRSGDRRAFLWTMAAVVAVLAVCTVLPHADQWKSTQWIHDRFYGGEHPAIAPFVRWSYMLVLLAFVLSTALVLTDRWSIRLVTTVFCLVCSVLFYKHTVLAILFGILLPTIIHVFFFTICFMWHGSLKSRSAWGHVNVVSMFLVPPIIALSSPAIHSRLSSSVQELTQLSSFDQVNLAINKFLGNLGAGHLDLYSPAFWRVQSFIAFAYTYHYLNWFSKTSIIKWHQVEKRKLVFSAVLWAASVGLFAVDYRLGFAASFALSVLHILLEFPLNYVSIQGVFRSLFNRKPVFKSSRVPTGVR